MTTSINPSIRVARLAEVTSPLDGGTLEFWSGARPAPGAAGAGVLQATATLPGPAGAIDTATFRFTFGTIGDVLRVDDKTIIWARYKNNGGVWIMDVDVGLLGAPSVPPEEILMGTNVGAVGAFLHFVNGSIQG